MASGKEYKISFSMDAKLDSAYNAVMTKIDRDFNGIERQIRDISGLRISPTILSGLQTATEGLERDMRQISRIPGPTDYFTGMKNDLRTLVPDLKDVKKALEEIARVRMPGDMFGNDMEKYLRETRELRDELERLQRSGGPPSGGGGGGGSGDPGGGGGIIALGGPAMLAGAAAVGLGAGAFSITEEYQKAMNQIQAATGASVEEMNSLRDSAKSVYGSNIGEGWEQISLVMSQAKQVTGQMGAELEATTKNAISLQDTFENLDVESSLKTATTLSKQFGITTDEAFNLIGQGAQQGLDYSGELLDSANEYAVYFKTLGVGAEEMFNVFKSGKESGAFNLDKIGDSVKEFGIRIKDGSKTTQDAMGALFAPPNTEKFISALNKGGKKTKEYGQLVKMVGDEDVAGDMLKKLQKGGVTGDKAITAITNELSGGQMILNSIADGSLKGTEAMSQVVTKLMEMDDKALQAQLGVALFGTQWEDMEASTIAALTNVNDVFDKTKDTMGDIQKVKYNTIGQAFRGIGRQIQTTFLLPLVDKALPALSAFSNWFNTAIPRVKSFFSSFTGGKGFGAISKLVSGIAKDLPALFKGIFSGDWAGTSAAANIGTNIGKALGLDDKGARGLAVKAIGMFNKVKGAFTSFQNFITPIFSKIQTAFGKGVTVVQAIFKRLAPVFVQVGTIIMGAVGRIISALTPVVGYIVNTLGPIIGKVIGFIATEVIPRFIRGFQDILPSIQKVVNAIGPLMQAIWGFIKPILDALVAAFKFAWPYIQTIVLTAVDVIKSIVGGLMESLSGVITFITGVFTGNWAQAWEGIKGIFSGVWEGIRGIAIAAINGVIRIINDGIKKINGISFDMPEVLGGGHVGTNIPTISEIGGSSKILTGAATNKSSGRMQAFARGGYSDRPAIMGEAGGEWAIPDRDTPRSRQLIDQAAKSVGYSPNQAVSVHYNPQFVIQGNADAEVIKAAAQDSYRDFERNYARMMKQQGRRALGVN